MKLSLLVGSLLLPSVLAQAPTSAPQDTRSLIQVYVRDAHDLATLQRLDLDLAGCTAMELPVRLVDVIGHDGDLARMRAAGLDCELVVADLEAHHARELAGWGGHSINGLTPPVGQGGMGGHYTLAEMEAILDALHQQYPNLCSAKQSIGTSIQGRNIWAVKISDNVGTDENEPEVYYDAVHHAREPLSMTTTLQFMSELLDGYGNDPEATLIVDERELWFVPCVNPDGYEYNRSTNPNGGGMWRKNRRNNGGSFGVDLNRNYSTGWSAPNGGNSTNPTSDTYRGPSAFSEPESAAVEAFMAQHNFVQSCTCHTYTEVLLHPWAYQNGAPSNGAEYTRLGARLTAVNGTPYGTVSGLLYIAAGGSVDHHHVVHNTIAWTPELGRSNEGGFWPTPPNQVAISQRHQRMFREMALTSGPLPAIVSVTVTEAPGGDGDGRIEPGESGLVTAVLANDGLAALTGGTLTLTALDPLIQITTGQVGAPTIPRLGNANSNATPLRFDVPANFAAPGFQLRIAFQGAGITDETLVDVFDPITLVATDMEVDHGFERATGGTATTGLWVRGLPQQTTSGGQVIQPNGQHTPGGNRCWVTDPNAGTSAGNFDVDSGYTDLLTPVLDLSHLVAAELRFYLWYVDSVSNDVLQIDGSTDGGQNWSPLLTWDSNTTSWTEVTVPVSLPLGNAMRFRIRAQDLNASLVEACVDDFRVVGAALDGAATLLTSGRVGSTLRLGMSGQDGAVVYGVMSAGLLGSPLTLPGIDGTLQVDPALSLVAPGAALGSDRWAPLDVGVPNDPGLVGRAFHFQAVHVDGASARIGNLQSVTLR